MKFYVDCIVYSLHVVVLMLNSFVFLLVTVAQPEAVIATPQLSHSVDVSQHDAGHHDAVTDIYERHNSEVRLVASFVHYMFSRTVFSIYRRTDNGLSILYTKIMLQQSCQIPYGVPGVTL